ncbi:unnamed protein product [Adineta ricciae]|uniref:Uncharacterized protein n=1 Tax=Adineta ricciae TaxID=249248 RepID=A0A815X6S2_ADIRI|nr:unnamed protein product [Adineta ricciae]
MEEAGTKAMARKPIRGRATGPVRGRATGPVHGRATEPGRYSTKKSVDRGQAEPVRRGESEPFRRGQFEPLFLKDIKGTIVTINRLKHYGFIKRRDRVESHDIFAREVSTINETRQRKFFVSDTCKFDIMKSKFFNFNDVINNTFLFLYPAPRGVEAVNIKIIERNINSISKLPKIPKKKHIDKQQQ